MKDVMQIQAEAAQKRQIRHNETVKSVLLGDLEAMRHRVKPEMLAQFEATLAAVKAAPASDERFTKIERSRGTSLGWKASLFAPK